MKIYFAAPFTLGPYVERLHVRAATLGHEPVSSWVASALGQVDNLPMKSQRERDEILEQNDSDVERADILVAIVVPGLGKEMFCEAALARLLGKPIYWIGREGDMPASAGRAGAAILPDDLALMAILQETAGADGLQRVRFALRFSGAR